MATRSQTDDEVDGDYVEEEPQTRAVTVVEPAASVVVGGMAGLARMSDEEFQNGLTALKLVRTRVDLVKEAIMRPGVDFGVIPGTDKPALLKPGAETLLRTFGLADSYRIEREVEYGDVGPDISIRVISSIHIGSTSGPVLAEGVGAANSWETRYRYRGQSGRACPKCGQSTVIRMGAKDGRPERWWCGRRDGGCGEGYEIGDPRITDQPDPGKAENPDPYDLENTLLKMAKKRALVDGILTATGTSGVFTQDEDSIARLSRGGARPPQGARAPETGRGAPQGPAAHSDTTSQLPAGPEGLQGVVEKEPDGIRRVKIKALADDNVHDKLEVVVKVEGRRHTIMLVDEPVQGVAALELRQGEIVRAIGGEVREIEWDPQKPKKKEVWGCSDVAVLRDGVWVTGNGAAPRMFDEPPAATEPAALAPSERREDGDVELGLVVRLTEPISFQNRRGRDVAVIRGAVPTTGEIIPAVLGDDPPGEIRANVGTPEEPTFRSGDHVIVVGTWQKGWLILSGVGKKPA